MVTTEQKGPQITTAKKGTETIKRVRSMVKEMYRQAHVAEAEGRPIAYASANNCEAEILRAMGITPVWWENYGGLCAAKRAAGPFLAKSDSEGFAGALCTYATVTIGCAALRAHGQLPEDAPDGGMPKPTVMIGGGMMICDPRHKLFQSLRRYYPDARVYIHHCLSPSYDANVKEVQGYYIKYMTEEFKGLVEFLEKQTGRKMDWDKLEEYVYNAEETTRLVHELNKVRESIPCVMPTQDAWLCVAPSFLLGSQEALDFTRDLVAEVKYRNEHKMGVIPDEKYRLLWAEGIAPWHSMNILNYFESRGAVMCGEGRGMWADYGEVPAGVTNPLERLAWRFFKIATWMHEKSQQHTGDYRVEAILRAIERYKVDGVVMHQVFTCRTIHVGQIHTLKLLRQYVDLPQLLLQGDIVDPNLFSEAEAHAKIDAFMELVEASKRRRQQD